ncbi:MAG TPA: oxidoreductase [Rhodospirillaceae bacterium]|nr:oxidoreductase [Rhodospirillaceae bacterium]
MGQGGLLDVMLHPDFNTNRLVFLTYSEFSPDRSVYTAMLRGKLRADERRLDEVKVLFRQSPKVGSGQHFGSRVLAAPDGNLFITLGDLGNRDLSQDLNGHVGKVVRVTIDGGIPQDNPLIGKTNARPEIWSYGHRNIQGADIHPVTGKLWTIEHGPRGGDEINIPAAGANYGWPLVSHGVEYSGGQIGDGLKFMDGVVPPVTTWTPVIAPGGMTFYTANLFPAWKGNLLIGGLRAGAIVRLELNDEKVVSEERLLRQIGNRIRDVAVGPDGAVYALDESEGRILRITPVK